MKTTTPGSRHRYVRYLLGFIALAFLVSQEYGSRAIVQAQGPLCNIACENAKPGNPPSDWQIVGVGDEQIQGFAVELSVNRGQTVQFKIQSLTDYGVEIYRLGYYGGNGARKVATLPTLPGNGNVIQPPCATEPDTGLVDCGTWSVTDSWPTDPNIPSGIFIARLIRSGGGASHIPFIVRDDNYDADLLFQTSDTTWQAYNRWGGGSLYCGPTTGGTGAVSNAGTVYENAECPGRAVKVSYNRPFDTRGHDSRSFLFSAEYPMVRWLEKNGYAVKYWTGVDTDRFGADPAIGLTSPKKPTIFLSVGHDEYWSGQQRANVEAARAQGVNLAFFSGNEVFWKTRWENSIANTGLSHKTLVGYKESLHNAEIDGSNIWTGTWRDARFTPPADGGKPENALTGQLWTVNSGTAAITVPEPLGKLRLWRNTAVATLPEGGSATLGVDTLGYEWDEDKANASRPPGLMRLSSTTVHDVQRTMDDNGVVIGQGPATHSLAMYRHPSGTYVFGAGTVQWSWGLDGNHDGGTPETHPPDVRMEQATVNLFADMGNVQPGSLASGLTTASPSSDSLAPTSVITAPGAGSLHAANGPVFIRGTATDAGGQVAAIEVSTNGGATWSRATGSGTWLYRWTPAAAGTYTIQSRAVDDSGNLEAAAAGIQVEVTSPGQAPGGPVLIVTRASHPFTSYYTEILRAEGFNIFSTADISTVTAGMLGSFDAVVLGEMPLSAGQVAMFSDWVTSGGNLIAMRPDKQLYGLLGLTDAAAMLSNGYLRVNSQTVPTGGIVNETIQFHGTADLATLSGAASVATLYSDAATVTAHPAATIRSVGAVGGQAAAFLYDLARSVVLTRQGNPAWEGQNRDLLDPIRSNDLFFGNNVFDPQTDWVNLNKVAIPQADEQQRLFANTLLYLTQDRKPLPRFWYFPRDEKAVVVMTGDAHGSDRSTDRLDQLANLSPPGCSLNDWECFRGTAYIYPETFELFDGGAGGVASYVSQGFEIALHPTTGCLDYTAVSLDQTFAMQLEQLAVKYPSMPAPRTNRTHCIVWSDYTSQAEVELQHGIRFDTTYYYWPGVWITNRPGFMTGSGMPMRFAKATGEIIDVYQAVTHMNDENNSSQTYPYTINTLLDKAIGPEGYYGAFTANMHGDGGESSDVKTGHIVASAQARGVPVVSSAQMLDWLDGRNNSSFGSLTWNNGTLSFTVTRAPGANGLRAMLPAFSGGTLDQITRNGVPIAFTLTTIKGVTYAFFDATTASYEATYLPDHSASIISNVSATALTASTALVTWNTNEGATTRVDYGTTAAVLNQVATDNVLMVNHGLTLTTLRANTTYYYRVASVDFFGNASAFPVAGDPPLSFTTPPQLQSFLDTTAADFSGGTPGPATLVAQTGDGEVILKPTDGSEFFGTSPPSGWTTGTYEASGYVTFANGRVTLNNGWMRAASLYGPGRSLEFMANFGADTFQHTGFGQTFDCGQPWAIFSTAGETNQLWARTTSAGCPSAGGPFQDTPIPGNWNGSMHRYRIDWNTNDVAYFIDGVEVARHNIQITPMMQILAASDFDPGTNPGELVLDWERMSAYPTPGEFLSRIVDAGAQVNWYNVAWTAGLPAGTDVTMAARTGNTPTPDASWTAFAPVAGANGRLTGIVAGQYLQYRATLSTTNSYFSPELRSVTVNHMVDVADTAPIAEDDAVTINENTPHTFAASGPGSLTANDVDAETPGQLTVIAVGNATNGTVFLNLDGSVTFTPTANFSGIGAFTYTVSDGALTDEGSVIVTINAVNDPPVGVADPSPAPGSYYQATEDLALLVPAATGVLANDMDLDNTRATLTAHLHTMPVHGTVTLNLDGSFTYRPAANFSGPDGFFYRVSDGTAQSAPTGVSIFVQGVNDAPVANNDRFTVSRSGVPLAVTSLVLAGSTVNATTTTAHGFATGHPVRIEGAAQAEYNGSFVVTATGPTTFSYPVTGAPVSPATGTIRATAEDTTRTFAVPGVIANDTDLEGQPLTASLGSTTTSNGTLVFNSDGSFTYTPDANFVGVDTFTYSLSDGFGVSGVATATITVHTEIAAAVVGEGGGTVSTGVTPTVVDSLETSVTTPIAGEVTIEQGPISPANPAAGYTFLGEQVIIKISTITDANPLTDPNTPVLITFTADRSLAAAGQTVQTLQVFRNGVLVLNCPAGPLATSNYPCVSERTTLADGDLQFRVKSLAPSQWNVGAYIAIDASMSTLEDTPLNGNVSSLSGHPNPGSLTFGSEIGPAHGTLTLGANGAFAYTPAPSYNGPDSFMFSAADGNGGVGFATVSITITSVNDAPTASNQNVTTNEDVAKVVTLSATDVDGGPLTYTIVTPPAHGSLSGTAPNLTYTPAANYAGADSFTFKATDNGSPALASSVATVNVTVTAVNDAPTIADIANQSTGGAAVGPVSFAVNDVDSAVAGLTLTGQSSNPTLVPNGNITFGGSAGNRTVMLTPVAGQTGSATITVTVSDGSLSAFDSFVVAVNASAASTTSTPTTSLNPATYGQAITFTATVTPGATGTVTFYDNGTPLGTAPLNGGVPNIASFTSSTTTALVQAGSPTGTARSITAVYNGDSRFVTSTSAALSQTVNKDGATAALTVSLLTAQYSDMETYEVTVTGAAGAAPAQGVIFKIGTQQMNATPQPFVSMGGGIYKATYTGQLLEEPPAPAGQLRPTGTNKIVSATYAGLSTNYTLPVPTNKTVMITKEDAALDLTVLSTTDVTASATGTATIPLTVKVQNADATPGDLRLAQVMFMNRSTGAVLATVNAAADGTATYNWPVTITGNSQSFQVGFVVTNYYNRNLTSDNRTIEVCKQGFCTP
jgi:VCBS repeat-containing protein